MLQEGAWRDSADVAIAFTTAGTLAGRRLRVLADALNFFPQYDAQQRAAS